MVMCSRSNSVSLFWLNTVFLRSVHSAVCTSGVCVCVSHRNRIPQCLCVLVCVLLYLEWMPRSPYFPSTTKNRDKSPCIDPLLEHLRALAMDWMSVLWNSHVQILTPMWSGSRAPQRSFDHEGRTLTKGISEKSLLKETPQNSLNPYAMWGHGEKSHPWTREWPVPRHWTC